MDLTEEVVVMFRTLASTFLSAVRGTRLPLLLAVALALPPTLSPGTATAQGTDIWLFDRQDGHRLVGRVTDRDGYDSQPAFSADGGALLFSSDRAGGQTDLFAWRLADGTLTNLTRTPEENEYSPQPRGADHYTFVLQEGVPYQNLWRRSVSGGEPERVLTSYVPVGYYAINDVGVLFWVRYANALFFEPAGADVGPADGESLFVIEDAGRSLHAIPGTDDFSFVHKEDWGWTIKRFDPRTRAVTPLVPIASTNEDYCWTPDGTLLTLDGTTLMAFRPGEGGSWRAVADLRTEGFRAGGRVRRRPRWAPSGGGGGEGIVLVRTARAFPAVGPLSSPA